MEEKEFNITPYFFSHKGDNIEEYKKLLIKSLEDYVEWRKEYHNEDFKLLKGYDENSEEHKEGLKRLETCYDEMLNRLHKSIPFHSPRYLGHMMSENFMPSVLANFATLLYHLNNVCYEGSPVTVEMEYEIAKDFAKMIGYDTDLSWGHLTGGGTVANIEALWVVRNMKYFPLIAQNLAKTFRKDFDVAQPNGHVKKLTKLSQYELLTLTPDAIKTLLKDFFELDWGRNINQDIYVNSHNISHVGMHNYYNGKIFVPASKHYSWDKAAEILGFGRKNIVLVEVDENFRMDTDDLKKKLIKSVERNEPIVAVVGVMGTTEASSVDSIDKIQEIKTYLEKEYNVSFFLHIDAAYGGYAKSLFLDKDNNVKSYEKVREYVGCDWPSKDIYNAYCSMHYADSVTVDPHKLGYLPFGSGAVIYKNKITKPATISHAPYISSSTNPENEDLFFGEYILEGSKSGAAAAACWLANKVIPLNDFGYGKLLKNEIIDSRIIISKFNKEFPFEVNGKKITVELFNSPDIDILLYAFNYEGNTDIDKFNEFNTKILKNMSFDINRPVNSHNYMVVSTTLDYRTYGNAINQHLKNLGLDIAKWTKQKSNIELFRTAVMNVNLYTDELKNYYYDGFISEIKRVISNIIEEDKLY